MTNPALNQSARQKNVANMLATLRIEKLSPSESLKPSLQAYVDGQKTTTDLLNEVKAKYLSATEQSLEVIAAAFMHDPANAAAIAD